MEERFAKSSQIALTIFLNTIFLYFLGYPEFSHEK